MPFHFRYTPCEIEGYSMIDFCDDFDNYIVAHEITSQKVEHFHIYIDAQCTKDTIVNRARKHLKIPKGQPGKANAYFMCKEWDENIDYFCKDGDITISKGFTPEQLQEAQKRGHDKFIVNKLVVKKEFGENILTSAGEAASAASPRNYKDEWSRLFESASELRDIQRTPLQWRKWITYFYTSRNKAIPRTGDLMRYSNSLTIILTAKKDKTIMQNLCDAYVESLEKI